MTKNMDNEVDQVITGLVSDDSEGNRPIAKSTDDSLDAALLELAPTIDG